jgi:hypothetical protein
MQSQSFVFFKYDPVRIFLKINIYVYQDLIAFFAPKTAVYFTEFM